MAEGSSELVLREQGTASTASPWQWIKDMVNKPGKEAVRMLKDNPDLVSMRMTLVCSEDSCKCSTDFEALDFEVNPAKKETETLHKLLSLLETGRCPHAPTEDSSSTNQTEVTTSNSPDDNVSGNPSSESDDSEFCTSDSTPVKNRFMKSGGSVVAGITAIHIASTFGKVKVVKYLIKIIQGPIRSPYTQCGAAATSLYNMNAYYHAVFHCQEHVLEMLLSLIKPFMRGSSVYPNFILGIIKLAVENDDIKALKLLVSPLKSSRRNRDFGFLVAIRNRSMKCLKHLGKNGAVLSPCCSFFPHGDHDVPCRCLLRMDDVIKDMLLQEDNTILEEILRMRAVDFNHMLFYAVLYDNKTAANLLLTDYRTNLKQKHYYMLPVIIMAVLNNSTAMLDMLLKCDIIKKTQTCRKYTAHNWARVLHFDKCAAMLEEAGVPYDEEADRDYPPLMMLHHIAIKSFYYSKTTLIQRMLQNGYDVNRESVNGITALYTALETGSYTTIRLLLTSGADPFIGRNCLTRFLTPRLLGELLYANVDIFRSRAEISLFRLILFCSPRFHEDLVFLLEHAHTIPGCDRKLLRTLQGSNVVTSEILEKVDRFLTKPPSLVRRTRDVIRMHYGYKIHDFVDMSHLPAKIRGILTLEGLLDHYLSMPFR